MQQDQAKPAAEAPCAHTNGHQELKESSAHDVLLCGGGTVHRLIAALRHLNKEKKGHQGEQQQDGPRRNMVQVHTA